MTAARVFLPDSEPARTSGVFAKRVTAPPMPFTITRRVRQIVPFGPLAVLLMPSCGEGLRATCMPRPEKTVDDLGLPLAQRIESWLGGDHAERIVPVADIVRPWLPVSRAAVVRIATVAWDAGAIIVPAIRIDDGVLAELRDLGFELGLELDEADRRACLSAFGD